jgi:hypothetical protein
MKTTLLIATVLFLSSCGTTPNKTTSVSEPKKNEHTSAFKTANTDEKSITISPNIKYFAEVTVEDHKITKVKLVDAITNPEITMTFDVTEMDKGTMLIAENPFKETIKYSIDMIDRKGKAYPTSSCPVIPKGSAVENWPHPIPHLTIKNFHFLDTKSNVGCEY